MAILRSRGASTWQVVGISLLQGVILGTVALAGGILLGYWITHSIGRARSFLDFSAAGGLRVEMIPQVLGYGLAWHCDHSTRSDFAPNTERGGKYHRHLQTGTCPHSGHTLVAKVLPGFSVAHSSRLRVLATAQAVETGFGGLETVPDPLQNPLLLLVPALGIFSVALFTPGLFRVS